MKNFNSSEEINKRREREIGRKKSSYPLRIIQREKKKTKKKTENERQ